MIPLVIVCCYNKKKNTYYQLFLLQRKQSRFFKISVYGGLRGNFQTSVQPQCSAINTQAVSSMGNMYVLVSFLAYFYEETIKVFVRVEG